MGSVRGAWEQEESESRMSVREYCKNNSKTVRTENNFNVAQKIQNKQQEHTGIKGQKKRLCPKPIHKKEQGKNRKN